MQIKRIITPAVILFSLSFLVLVLAHDDTRKFFYDPPENIDQRELDSWNDTVLWTSSSSSLPENLYLVPNEPQLGYMTYTDSALRFVKDEIQHKFWEYEDYSNLHKITLSSDKETIRAFVTFTLFESEERIFEFDTKTKKRRKYSIKNHPLR